jgi:glyoxylase-like metal-dependent hydrolase (beta-lactamase superfamily II)
MNEQIQEFQLGDFHAWLIQDENGGPSAREAFTSATEEEIKAAAERFGFGMEDKLDLSCTVLLVDTGKEKIIFDTGNGLDTGGEGRLFPHLERLGIRRESIDIVVLSHAHADHYAGILSGEGSLNFPNAKHFIWREEWDFYSSAERLAFEKNRSQERYDFIHKYFLPIAPHWHFLDEKDSEITEGVCAIPAKGHSKHHIALRLESKGEILYYLGDAFLHPAYIENLHWSFAVDIEPAEAKLTRKLLAARIAAENALVLGYHFPFPSLGRIVEDKEGFRWKTV